MKTPDWLAWEENGDVLIARVLAEVLLDSESVQLLSRELLSVLSQRKRYKLVVNFSRVARCSTEVINCLLIAKKRLLAEGGDLGLCEVSENIRHTYRILNLDGTVFQIFDSESEAVDAFSNH